ncbi:hypothetical protein QFZ34_000544 [Phyllobacterium ifriqiyense]|uniref:Uncharacterized protein n=1 Tax=Phyllobacterium ifriqiyense TaxID=314238 RepID=A0ABU0S3Q2_9HYPH|nr:hypothetical protein [Phyllobacterium ifriqiyense]MDQ0995367.1 hypothetical protein [Phyllobacterium ifriqiyense]
MTLDGAKGSGILRSGQTELPVTYTIKKGKDALQSDTVATLMLDDIGKLKSLYPSDEVVLRLADGQELKGQLAGSGTEGKIKFINFE